MPPTNPTFEVIAELTASTSVQEFAKVFEGLESLHRQQFVRLRIQAVRGSGPTRLLRLKVTDDAGVAKQVAIDIDDDPQIAEPDLLDALDVYFKRSITPATPKPSPKVRPFGLNNPAISQRTAVNVLRSRSATARTMAQLARDARQLLALPSPRAFEIAASERAEPLILYQTRLWSPDVSDPDREEINEERASLIRALRRAFGKRFIGGAIPTEFVEQHYADLATREPFSMRAYPRLLRRPLIAVYSRGLRDSVGFKMSEYLAASRCIVGHVPASELPEPLVANEHYLPFWTAEECISQCEQLLSDVTSAAAMRMANERYYRANVEPAAHLRSILGRAFQRD